VSFRAFKDLCEHKRKIAGGMRTSVIISCSRTLGSDVDLAGRQELRAIAVEMRPAHDMSEAIWSVPGQVGL
jgi:hypothetical protein